VSSAIAGFPLACLLAAVLAPSALRTEKLTPAAVTAGVNTPLAAGTWK
jgi:hypothetical protein